MTKVAGLFEGVGMFTRAALALGCELAWSVEIDDWNRALLEQRYPDAIHRKDVREVGAGLPEVEGFVLGFPCQDISNAGRREGISGKRSGLWGEAARLIGIYEPKWVVIENVSALKHRGLNTVLDDLHKLGYDATWDCIPALAVGAPHIRDRIWIVATQTGTVVAPAMFPAWEHGSLPKELPRAGTMTAEGVFYGTPRAEVGACKRAVKRGRPLFPTPEASDGTGGRVSVEVGGQRARNGFEDASEDQIAEAQRLGDGDLFPTPAANDHKGDVVSHLRNKHGWDGGERSRITSLAVLAKNDFQQATPEQIEEARSTPPAHGKRVETWPTLVASDAAGSRRSTARTEEWTSNEGTTLLDAVSEVEGIIWATPTRSDGAGGPGSSGREGGDNLRTQVTTLPTPRASDGDPRNRGDLIAHVKERPNSHHPGERAPGRENERRAGALNPDWVEWLMGMPVGWTNPDCAKPVQLDWGSEYEIPRTAVDVPHRRARLTAIGNALVWKVAVFPIYEAMSRA